MSSDGRKTSVDKRGSAYECVPCSTTSKPVINSWKYVVNHYRKKHLTLEECPAYCRLCDYRCDNQEELIKHTETFQPHRKIVDAQRQQGLTINPEVFFGYGSKVKKMITENEIKFYTKEESRKVYENKRKEHGRSVKKEENTVQVTVLPTAEERKRNGQLWGKGGQNLGRC